MYIIQPKTISLLLDSSKYTVDYQVLIDIVKRESGIGILGWNGNLIRDFTKNFFFLIFVTKEKVRRVRLNKP